MTFTDPAALSPAEFVRDRWLRPLIIPPEGGTPVPYTRASSAAKTVEDTWNLELWARRNVAYGMARDPSLPARLLALSGDPSTWDMDTKQKVNAIVEDASAVALAHRAADIGTAVHRMTELLDRGQKVEAGPYAADLEAYVNALITAGFTVTHVECRLVCDELQMAGTADRILRQGAGHVIADLKTGETVDYGGLGWAAQLATYAHSQLYDVETGIRTPTPALDQSTGIIIHLPAGQGRCTLYEIDLVAGYRAAQLANEIRAVRRAARRWISPLPETVAPCPGTSTLPVDVPDRRTVLQARYHKLDGARQRLFRDRGIDRDDLDLIEQVLDQLEPVAVPDDILRDSTAVADLNAALLTVNPEQKAWLDATARESVAGLGTISFRYEPHERNVWVCRALLACCQADIDGDGCRKLLEAVIDSELPSTVTLGAALSALTTEEAERLHGMAAPAVT